MTKNRLIVFTRYPLPGKAKTRLIPALGAEGAAALQRQMTEQTLLHVKELLSLFPVSVEIWFAAHPAGPGAPADRQPMQDWLGPDWVYRLQGPGDLGDRLAEAFQAAFADGAERVVAIGTDCPGLNAQRLRQAFQQLEQHELVLGPATDGGYYLIGLRRFAADLFPGIAWGSARVFQQTIEAAQQVGLTAAQLEPLTDVDRPEDLPVWQAALAERLAASAPEEHLSAQLVGVLPQAVVSVILPVLNEATTIEMTLDQLQQAGAGPVEVIVVDGGSQDTTVDLARARGAKVIQTLPGRAHQMNIGAEAATAELLLFLHADTRLPKHFVALVQQTLAQPGAIAGAFELRIEGDLPGLRLVEWGVKWRSRLLQLPYGDQALFLKAETFRQLGGFPELPIMEDFVFVRRLQAAGRVAIAPASVLTSGRRWQQLGVWQTTLINQLVIAAYFLGVPAQRLARWYRGCLKRQGGNFSSNKNRG